MRMWWGDLRNSFKVLILIFLIFFALGKVNAIGMGISTQTVHFKDILRGGYAESEIIASNPNSYDVQLKVQIIGEIAPWISLDPAPPNIIIPANSNGAFNIIIQPPPFVKNGVYTGEVIVLTGDASGSGARGTGSAITAGAAVSVFIEISDNEISDFKLARLRVDPTEECNPITFGISTKNIGNVEAEPTYNIKLYSNDKSEVLKEKTETFDPIPPTITKSDYIQLDYKLGQFKCIPVGEYVAEVTGTLDGEMFYTNEVDVQIVEKGTITLKGTFLNMTHAPKANVGEPLKIIGLYENKGIVREQAKLNVEAYKGDRLVSVITGDEVFVEPGEPTELTAFFVPSEIGEYTLKGSVNFGGKPSNIIETDLVIQFGLTMLLILIAIPTFIGVIIAVVIYKKRKRGY